MNQRTSLQNTYCTDALIREKETQINETANKLFHK